MNTKQNAPKSAQDPAKNAQRSAKAAQSARARKAAQNASKQNDVPDFAVAHVVGYVAGEPTLSSTHTGRHVCNFKLDVRETIELGARITTRIECSVWDEVAYNSVRDGRLRDGKRVAVVGKIRRDIWGARGSSNARQYILVDTIKGLPGRAEEAIA